MAYRSGLPLQEAGGLRSQRGSKPDTIRQVSVLYYAFKCNAFKCNAFKCNAFKCNELGGLN